jgi:hypothetical protein
MTGNRTNFEHVDEDGDWFIPWHYEVPTSGVVITWGGDHDDWELDVRDVPVLKAIRMEGDWRKIGRAHV